jgi:hypothetical protein
MPQINVPGSGHGIITSPAGNRYWEYTDKHALRVLNQAFYILKHNVKGMRPCNDCFKKLPGGRTFAEVWDDDSVWINYEPRDRDWYGITLGVGGNDISISQIAFNKGRWWVAGTLVHELAHVNGAPISTGQADDTLLCCGIKDAYEGAIGMSRSGTDTEIA